MGKIGIVHRILAVSAYVGHIKSQAGNLGLENTFQLEPAMVRANGPEKFRQWEDDFRDVYAYLTSIESPKYPYSIDAALAKTGQAKLRR